MTAETILIAGKALIWFAIPLGIAVWELWRLRGQGRDSDRDN